MNKNIRVIHHSPVATLGGILLSGKLLPKSTLAGLASCRRNRLLFFLPRSFAQMGIFGIFDSDIEKWKNNSQIWKYLIRDWMSQNHSEQSNGKIAKITFELTDQDDVYVLDENILLVFTEKIWKTSSFWDKLRLIFELRKVSINYVNTKIKLVDYKNDYVLPVVFIRNEIPAGRITHEILDL